MGHTIPRQHPAVVLRSHYLHLRALLVVALVAIVALAGTVIVLAVDDDAPSASAKTPGVQVMVRRAAIHGKATPAHGSTRPDGGPDEGTRGLGR